MTSTETLVAGGWGIEIPKKILDVISKWPPKDGLMPAEIAGAKGHDDLREVIERFSRRKSLLADVPAEDKKSAGQSR